MKITQDHIESVIAREEYFTAFEGIVGNEVCNPTGASVLPSSNQADKSPFELLTFCVLVLTNGFTITGESSCVSPANFDAEIGRKIAREKAIEKIWPLEGYLLKQKLFEAK